MKYRQLVLAVIIVIFIAGVIFSIKQRNIDLQTSPNIQKAIDKTAQLNLLDNNVRCPDLVVCKKFISPPAATCQILRSQCTLCGGSGTIPTSTCYEMHTTMTEWLIYNFVHPWNNNIASCYSCYAVNPGMPMYEQYKDVSNCCVSANE